MKSSNLSLSSLTRPLASFVRRFHTLLFFLIVSTSLGAAILVLISIIGTSSETASSSDQTVNGSFDDATIQRIQSGTVPTQPSGRPSPFVE